jgi:hypothetical protein
VLLKNGDQAVDFRMAALAVKPFRMAANIVAMQAVQYFVARQLHHEVIGDNKKAVGQVFAYSPNSMAASGPWRYLAGD